MARVWTSTEIDAIVKDYLVMLELEQTGKAYSKTEHRHALMEKIERSKKSIEFKHMNISAVLDKLGLPYIKGYTPLGNYQRALFEAVEAHRTENPGLFDFLTCEAGTLQKPEGQPVASESIVFDESPPQHEPQGKQIPKDIGTIIRKFEFPAERDARNRNLGKAGEELVYEYEKSRLQTVGRKDLSDRVRWVARDDGDGYGYDILSFSGKGNEADREIWLEVKTTNGSAATPFYITRNELQVSKQRPDVFRIFRLYDFRMRASAYYLTPPLEKYVSLTPTIFRASF